MESDPKEAPKPNPIMPKVSGGASEQLAKEVVTKDQVYAGYFLVAMALVNIALGLVVPEGTGPLLFAAGIDLLIGGCIVAGLFLFVLILKIRLFLGFAAGLVIATIGGNPVMGGITLLLTGSLSLLVFGEVSKGRRITGLVLLSLFFLNAFLGLILMLVGTS